MGAAMRTLILLRHAKAERDAESGQDFDRALTNRGWADARLIGRVLADAGFVPDRARVSAARRAAQTWEAVATAFPLIEASVLPELFHAGPERLMAEIEGAAQDGETLLVVAHNPGLHTLALRWARASRAPETSRIEAGFPTGAAAVFRSEGAETPSLEAFFAPSALGGGAHGG